MKLGMLLLLNLLLICVCQAQSYIEKHFDQNVDHFNYVSYGEKTFKQRYLVQGEVIFTVKADIEVEQLIQNL